MKTIKKFWETLKNAIAYFQGFYRYNLYYSKSLKTLIRPHIREQIDHRIEVMNPDCYTTGSCVKCGCQTTALQMANKTCEGKCYPVMFSREGWDIYKDCSTKYKLQQGRNFAEKHKSE